jgi:hypothetical protein
VVCRSRSLAGCLQERRRRCAIPDPVQPREGEVAFAVSVATLYDLTIGRVAWPVRFTRHRSVDQPTLTLANRQPGGPILNILPINPETGDLDTEHPIFVVLESGIQSQQIGGWIDLSYQPAGTPAPPGAGTDTLRMYAREGGLFFRTEDSPLEQQIPVGDPPGPSVRWSFWMSGG